MDPRDSKTAMRIKSPLPRLKTDPGRPELKNCRADQELLGLYTWPSRIQLHTRRDQPQPPPAVDDTLPTSPGTVLVPEGDGQLLKPLETSLFPARSTK